MRLGRNFALFLCILLSDSIFANSKISEEVQRDFDRSQELIKAGLENEALVSLTDFLRRHSGSDLADDAQYWIAEMYFRRRNFEQALEEFKKVLSYKNRKADKIPEAVLRLGDCWQRLGFADRARIEWEALGRNFPASSFAEDAKTRLQGLNL